jgi:hypothetical protein
MDVNIKLQYFGTMRLLFNVKEEVMSLDYPLTLGNIIDEINTKHGHDFLKNANHLMIFYYPYDGEESRQIKFPRDKDVYLKNKSTVKIFNALTLG